ncbi:O-methyltransferase [Hymenobacter sp. GOD-10R]|uniref:O-methyltransferase n=1 Tax=Hymenobacter sp. GOD-10R TaxID=3093922 RepID=UPI002D771354|nr:class I SAM-dependent methyltransferase [Hymenobacter sp. GOD-10R]WRQ30803.1 class I SAM-dependent methyltransferase [Hymenobacter sp. GOD-10R]
MNQIRAEFLRQLAEFGQANDQQATRRDERLLNITPDTGPFLALLIKATQARAVLEIGTSNGYSTIWLADAVQATGGHVTTVEVNEARATQARHNFQQAAFIDTITLEVTPAESFLPTIASNSFDFIFLDSDRTQYCAWWPLLHRLLRPGGLMVVDNAVSHQHQLVAFLALVEATRGTETSLVPLGKGELLIWKQR